MKTIQKNSLIANGVTTIDIAEPIRVYITPDCSLFDANCEFDEDDIYGIVQDDNCIYGYIENSDTWEFDPNVYIPVSKYVKGIRPDMIVSSNMAIQDLIPLFMRKRIFFVLDKNSVTHVVTYDDINKLPVKFYLFSLFMELEDLLIKIFSHDNDKLTYFLECLPQGRLAKAKELCNLRYKDHTTKKVLLCTTFADKKTMMKNDIEFRSRFFSSNLQLDAFFKLVEGVRNKIAHGDTILDVLNEPSKTNELITKLISIIESLYEIYHIKKNEIFILE